MELSKLADNVQAMEWLLAVAGSTRTAFEATKAELGEQQTAGNIATALRAALP